MWQFSPKSPGVAFAVATQTPNFREGEGGWTPVS